MMGLMYLRKKNPPMKELTLSLVASGNFSRMSARTALHSHLMPYGTLAIVSLSLSRILMTRSCSTGSLSSILLRTSRLASACKGQRCPPHQRPDHCPHSRPPSLSKTMPLSPFQTIVPMSSVKDQTTIPFCIQIKAIIKPRLTQCG